jgi:inosine-uridine nucleoside N-ribohydrolase
MKNIILDTDIGIDPDDFVTLLYGLNSKEINIPLIVTALDKSGYKKNLVNKILDYKGLNNKINVVKGRDNYGYIDFTYVDTSAELKNDNYLDAINTVIENNDEVYYLGLSCLSTFDEYIQKFGVSSNLKLVQMGGNETRYEYNFSQDMDSAIRVFNNRELEKILITSEITNNDEIKIKPNSELIKIINSKKGKEYDLLKKNIEIFISLVGSFNLHDPLTLSYVFDNNFLDMKKGFVNFVEKEKFYINKYDFNINGDTNISIDTNYSDFLKFLYPRI